MKANEAPEKIYLTSDEKNSYVFTQKRSDGKGIEYIRTDAFIEKACVKLKKLMYDNLMFQGRLHREEIIETFVGDFRKCVHSDIIRDCEKDDAIAWLEKQSKKSKVEQAMRELEEKAEAFTEAHKGETSEEILAQMRGEQKPAWSEEDESRMNNLCHFLEEYGTQYYGYLTLQCTIYWLKYLKDRVQPKVELTRGFYFEFNPNRSFEERCEIARRTAITPDMTYDERLAMQKARYGL